MMPLPHQHYPCEGGPIKFSLLNAEGEVYRRCTVRDSFECEYGTDTRGLCRSSVSSCTLLKNARTSVTGGIPCQIGRHIRKGAYCSLGAIDAAVGLARHRRCPAPGEHRQRPRLIVMRLVTTYRFSSGTNAEVTARFRPSMVLPSGKGTAVDLASSCTALAPERVNMRTFKVVHTHPNRSTTGTARYVLRRSHTYCAWMHSSAWEHPHNFK